MGWGSVGAVSKEKKRRGGPTPVRYWVEDRAAGKKHGCWLSTAEIASDPRNTRRLSPKGVQSRLDRLRSAGFHPKATGGKEGMAHPKANHRLKWSDFTSQALIGNNEYADEACRG